MRLRAAALTTALAVLLAACSGTAAPSPEADAPASSPTAEAESTPDAQAAADQDGHAGHAGAKPTRLRPLREGEDRLTVTMPEAYTPSPPTGTGTDDYRCFLLDPQLARDRFLTGTNVVPGNPDVVHHVILFRVLPDQVGEAEALDAETDDPGWTCFGGSGLAVESAGLDDAGWLGAWAPGGDEAVTRAGYGVEMPAGSQIVMQVHYSLLTGPQPDMSSTQLRVSNRGDLEPLHTYLLPAPVEMPCRADRADDPLCDRDAAVADVKERFGIAAGGTADALHLLCGSTPEPSTTSTCTRTIGRPMTILATAGHMHLLGRRITVRVGVGTADERTVLDIDPWDFDDQGARAIEPVELEPFDEVSVTCRHAQWPRDLLPSFEGQPDRYVVWGEGTTDEMCLGILSVAYR